LIAVFNASRLTLARHRRGLSKRELAEQTDLSTRSISAYESGDSLPQPLTVLRLARALNFPAAFFERPDLDEPPEGSTSFRALSTLTTRQSRQAQGAAALALDFSDWIEERFQLPSPDVLRLQGVSPEAAAEGIRREWKIGNMAISNMVHLLEQHGVRVFSLAEECAEVDAFSFWRLGRPYVFLNTMKSAEHSRMDAAHELGHLCLHWRHGQVGGREVEVEAQAFASAFLMPSGPMIAEAPRSGRIEQLIKYKKRWKVSIAALTYRMHALGLLSDWQYRSLFIEMGDKGYRKKEPESVPHESSQVLGKVFKTLRDDGITRTEVAQTLAIPVEELNKLMIGLVLVLLDNGRDSSESQAKRAL
jgi:Zn-dependent peptidase ImmA (M78 family)/DNA-binding XRE family transcriptional regulator